MNTIVKRVVKEKSKAIMEKYLDSCPEVNLDDGKKSEYGFYFLTLSALHGISLDKCEQIIIDSDFCKSIESTGNIDLGVDAVYIDDVEQKVYLYIFKFCHSDDKETGQKENPIHLTSKFTDRLSLLFEQDEDEIDYSGFSDKTKEVMMDIVQKVNATNTPYSFFLRQISNDDLEPIELEAIRKSKPKTSILTDIECYCLFDIYDLFFAEKKEIVANMVVPENRQLSYSEDENTTVKHYVVSLPLIDLVRITCNDAGIRGNVDFEFDDDQKISLETNILYDNVRGFILKSSYNESILETLDSKPSMFFMYNNGITIIVNEIKVPPVPDKARKRLTFSLKGMQIVNGGQTLRTVYKFIDSIKGENWVERLDSASILVKIVHSSSEEILSDVARYTNSQNPISPYDLKSMDVRQVALEKYLEAKKVRYIRKNGDVPGIDTIDFEYEMEMTLLGQLLFSINGGPNKASAAKKKIFTTEYDAIFGETNVMERAYELTTLVYKIKEEYKKSNNTFSDQKMFYVVYAYFKTGGRVSLDELIKVLETELDKYRTKKELSNARKLLLNGFFQAFDKKLHKEYTSKKSEAK